MTIDKHKSIITIPQMFNKKHLIKFIYLYEAMIKFHNLESFCFMLKLYCYNSTQEAYDVLFMTYIPEENVSICEVKVSMTDYINPNEIWNHTGYFISLNNLFKNLLKTDFKDKFTRYEMQALNKIYEHLLKYNIIQSYNNDTSSKRPESKWEVENVQNITPN